jgi:putative ABC transport system permease protein
VSVAVIVTVGLALAANTALFSVFDGLLFRPLRYRDAASIVHLQLADHLRLASHRRERLALLERLDVTTALTERADAQAVQLFDRASAAASDWQLRPYAITASLFDLLGVRPMLGRPLSNGDIDAARFTVLLGHELWKTRFGGDPSVVGKAVQIPGTSAADRWYVVGIMPPGFSFPQGANFWIPRYRSQAAVPMQPYARLAPGTSAAQVRAQFPGLVVTPLREHVRSGGAVSVGVLLGATVLLLVLAWVHVASLLFGRAAGKAREIGTRLALGASQWQLIRGFVMEAGMLTLPAFGVAIAAAPILVTALVEVLPPAITLGQDVAPDLRAMGVALALSGIGLVMLTVLPMDLVRRGAPSVLLRGGIFGDIKIRTTRIRHVLFIGQLTVVTTIVYLTCLLSISFSRATAADFGFASEGLFAIRMPRREGPTGGGPDARALLDRQREMVRETLNRLVPLGAVVAAAGSSSWPLEPNGVDTETFYAESDPAKQSVPGGYQSIMQGYPGVLGVPLAEGSEPSSAELPQLKLPPAQQFGLANRALARHLQQFGPVIGQVVAINASRRYRIVGVMPDVVLERFDRPVRPTIFGYLPPPATTNVVLVRLAHGIEPEAAGVVGVLSNVWGQRSPRPMAMSHAIELAIAEHKSRAHLLISVAIVSIPLALLGVAGALSYATRQRQHDIAVTLAIGASPADIRRRIFRQAIGVAVLAVVVGLGIGVVSSRLISGVLYNVGAVNVGALVASGTLIILLVALSAAVPAWQAGSINPANVLRGA